MCTFNIHSSTECTYALLLDGSQLYCVHEKKGFKNHFSQRAAKCFALIVGINCCPDNWDCKLG